jgi:pyruvate formate lyase activating enzyme
MLGCNFHCDFCQNWQTSQVLRDPNLETSAGMVHRNTPDEIVHLALQSQARVIASSYNEPIITAEWAKDIFTVAKINGLRTVMISNGYATSDALDYLKPVLDGYKIDLKSMQDRNYRAMGGVLSHVIDSIAHAHELGLWVEVVTLVIPEYNSSPEELWDAARTIRSVSADIPWHVTAFHPDYKMFATRATMPRELQVAADIGQEAGLHYVYAGNLPGKVGSMENTYCPSCNRLLIGRSGYRLTEYHITAKGSCPDCHTKISGVWSSDPSKVQVGKPGFPWKI